MKSPYVQIPNHIARCADLTSGEFRLLIVLMSIKPCYPSYEALSEWTGMSRNTVNRNLNSLKAKGIISWKRGHGYGQNNRYFIHPKSAWKLPKFIPQNRDTTSPKTGTLKRLIREFELRDELIEPKFDSKFDSLKPEELTEEIQKLESERNQDSDKLDQILTNHKKSLKP